MGCNCGRKRLEAVTSVNPQPVTSASTTPPTVTDVSLAEAKAAAEARVAVTRLQAEMAAKSSAV